MSGTSRARGSSLQLACKKAALSAGGNWEAHEATKCGLKVHKVPSHVPLGGIPAAALTNPMTFNKFFHFSEPWFPHLQNEFVNNLTCNVVAKSQSCEPWSEMLNNFPKAIWQSWDLNSDLPGFLRVCYVR